MQALDGDVRAGSGRHTLVGRVSIRPPRREELEPLVAWLDRGLRRGRPGRLRAEYPTALDPGCLHDHLVAWDDERPVAHVLARRLDAHAAGTTIPVGLLGLVYTDPEARGRGLASACIEAGLASLGERGAHLAVLWSDLDGFYTRLGFHRAGFEWSYRIDAAVCTRARRALPGHHDVGAPEPTDWPVLEALYGRKPARAVRPSGELARLASAPDCALVVARQEGRPRAYAACGRGDDLQGVVHEWAGDPTGVLACLDAFLRDRAEVGWLLGPMDEPPAPTLRAAGAARLAGDFAWVRLLDAKALWDRLGGKAGTEAGAKLRGSGDDFLLDSPRGRRTLSHAEAAGLILGPRRSLANPFAGIDSGMSRGLPWPMFLWGFDSV